MYVAVKGGQNAIENSQKLREEDRRGNPEIPEIDVQQIVDQLTASVDRVMTEGSLYDRELAALAIKQTGGDVVEAIFLLRAYRSTLPRLYYSEPIDGQKMAIERRISASFKDLPGGQVLGPTFDYSHRLLDFDLLEGESEPTSCPLANDPVDETVPRVLDDLLGQFDVMQQESVTEENDQDAVGDLTRGPIEYPVNRDVRLQNLARADEGFLVSLAYSTMRGFGDNHGFVGELRQGSVPVEICPSELGFSVEIGDIDVSECETINQYAGSNESAPQFTRGYGIIMGRSDRKVIAMAIMDRALRARELGEEPNAPAQDEEFVMAHCDNTQASGFVEHIKLPHYGGFQSELAMLRRLREEAQSATSEPQAVAAPK